MAVVTQNLTSSFNVLKAGAPLLAEGGGGAIVCVGAAVVHHGARGRGGG